MRTIHQQILKAVSNTILTFSQILIQKKAMMKPLNVLFQHRHILLHLIGSAHDGCAQECLCTVSKLLRENKTVEVEIMPEPNNQCNAMAIAFYCGVNDDNEWKRIGYFLHSHNYVYIVQTMHECSEMLIPIVGGGGRSRGQLWNCARIPHFHQQAMLPFG